MRNCARKLTSNVWWHVTSSLNSCMQYLQVVHTMEAASASAINSRDRGVRLIGGTLSEITGSKLPSNRQVLARFFHAHVIEKLTIQNSAVLTTRELVQLWMKAKIPTRQEYNIVGKMKDLYGQWQALKKNATRKSDTQKSKEKSFSTGLDDLFDVAHANAMELLKIDEDKKLLEAQREKGRRGCMGSVDSKLVRADGSSVNF